MRPDLGRRREQQTDLLLGRLLELLHQVVAPGRRRRSRGRRRRFEAGRPADPAPPTPEIAPSASGSGRSRRRSASGSWNCCASISASWLSSSAPAATRISPRRTPDFVCASSASSSCSRVIDSCSTSRSPSRGRPVGAATGAVSDRARGRWRSPRCSTSRCSTNRWSRAGRRAPRWPAMVSAPPRSRRRHGDDRAYTATVVLRADALNDEPLSLCCLPVAPNPE